MDIQVSAPAVDISADGEVHLNHNDGNNNATEDREEGPGPLYLPGGGAFNDNDLKLVTITVDGMAASQWANTAAGGSQGYLAGVALHLSHSENLKLWRTWNKEPLALTYTFTSEAPSNVPDEFYVEGIELSSGGSGGSGGGDEITFELIAPTDAHPEGEVVASDSVEVSVVPRVDLAISNDRTELFQVPEDKEEAPGAFTVANLNDTDADGTIDRDDDSVIATPEGENEVDLRLLEVRPPIPNQGGGVVLHVGFTARIWTDFKKLTLVTPDTCGDILIPTAELPKQYWVEMPGAGTTLISASYTPPGTSLTGRDTVKLTGVWASLSAVEHDTHSAEYLAERFPDMTNPPAQAITDHGGTGLLPMHPQEGICNGIVFSYVIQPNGEEPARYFDLARRIVATRECYKNGELVEARQWDYPEQTDASNDDPTEIDESDTPTTLSHMYSYDWPGLPMDLLNNPAYDEIVLKMDALEYVRFDPIFDPKGGDLVPYELLNQSRASDFYPWHTAHHIKRNAAGNWERTTGDQQEVFGVNDIGPGNILP